MNSWNQPMNNNLTMGGASFSPYYNQNYNFNNSSTVWPQQQQQRAPVYHAEPIHGEAAAWSFPISGGDIWLPDADRDIIWWIRVDQNGNKYVKPFDVTPHEEKPQVDTNDLAARLAAVEEWINGKQNKSNAKRNVPVANSTTVE